MTKAKATADPLLKAKRVLASVLEAFATTGSFPILRDLEQKEGHRFVQDVLRAKGLLIPTTATHDGRPTLRPSHRGLAMLRSYKPANATLEKILRVADRLVVLLQTAYNTRKSPSQAEEGDVRTWTIAELLALGPAIAESEARTAMVFLLDLSIWNERPGEDLKRSFRISQSVLDSAGLSNEIDRLALEMKRAADAVGPKEGKAGKGDDENATGLGAASPEKGWLRAAVEKLPELRTFVAITGVSALAATASMYATAVSIPRIVGVVGTMIGLGVVFALFRTLVEKKRSKGINVQLPVYVLLWLVVILTVLSGCFAASSFWLGLPLDWRPGRSASTRLHVACASKNAVVYVDEREAGPSGTYVTVAPGARLVECREGAFSDKTTVNVELGTTLEVRPEPSQRGIDVAARLESAVLDGEGCPSGTLHEFTVVATNRTDRIVTVSLSIHPIPKDAIITKHSSTTTENHSVREERQKSRYDSEEYVIGLTVVVSKLAPAGQSEERLFVCEDEKVTLRVEPTILE